MSLSPTEVMKSMLSSTLFFLAQSSASCFITALAPGTQWSQSPKVELAGGMGGLDVGCGERGAGGERGRPQELTAGRRPE